MAYQHGMRAPSESVAEAEGKAARFYEDRIAEASRLQAAAEARGATTVTIQALFALGEGLHPVADATSPEHEGFQVWRGTSLFELPAALDHVDGERWMSPEREQVAIQMLRAAYAEAFGMQRLKEAITVPVQGPCLEGIPHCLRQ
jgi:hypothetical protein